MKTNTHPYARTLDAAPPQKLELPAHVDGQLHLQPGTIFLLGLILGAALSGLCQLLLIILFF